MARITTILPGSTQGTRLEPAPVPFQQLRSEGAAVAQAGVVAARESARQTGVAADEVNALSAEAQRRTVALIEAGQRLEKRNDDLARARGENAARTRINDLVEAERTQGDNFSTEDSIRQFRDALNGLMSSALTEFGSELKRPESAVIFMEQLETLRGEAERSAISAGLATSEAALDENVSNFVSDLTQLINASPASLDLAVDEVNAKIDRDYAGSVTPEKELATRQAAIQQLATAAVDKLVAQQDLGSARRVMSNDRIIQALDQDRMRELNLKIARLEGEITDDRAKGMNTFSVISQVDPTVEFTNQLAQRAAQIELPLNPNPEEVVGAYRQLVGEPSPEVVQAAHERFSATLRLSDINDSQLQSKLWLGRNSAAFAAGNLSPQAQVDFVQAANRVVQENSITGARGELSPVVREALRARGFNPDKMGGDQPEALRQLQAGDVGNLFSTLQPRGGLSEEQELQVTESLEQAEQVLTPAMEGSRVNPPRPDEDPAQRPNTTFRRQNENGIRFFAAADLLTGPISGIQNFLFGVPFLGESIPSGSNIALYRQEFELFKVATISALRRTERFADAERQHLIGVTLRRLQSSAFQNPEEMAIALVGLDDGMAGEIEWARGVLSDPSRLSREAQASVRDRMETAQFIRSLIGAPPIIETVEQAAQALGRGEIRAGQRLVARRVDPVTGLPEFMLVIFSEGDVERLRQRFGGQVAAPEEDE